MKIQETPLSTILIIPASKWGLVWWVIWTAFSLGMVVSFIFEAESFGWDLRNIQWVSESGEESGPIGNVFHSLMFVGMASIFSVIGIWLVLRLEREVRIAIDKDRFGNVSVIRSRWLIKDKKYLIPLVNVNSVEIVTGDSETGDRLYIKTDLYCTERLEVDCGNKKALVPMAQTLSECLNVQFIER